MSLASILFNTTLSVLLVGILIPHGYAAWRGVIKKIRDGYWDW